MKFTKSMAATLMCSVVLLCGCTKNSDVVLKVNNTEITRSAFYDDYNKLKNIQLKQAKGGKTERHFIALSIKERYMDDIITRTLLEEEFAKRKIEATQEEINAKKAEIISRMGSEETFNKILKENKISTERLQHDLANEVKGDKLASQIAPKAVTDKEISEFYNKNKAGFAVPETIHAYHILISTNANEIKRNIVDADKNANLTEDEINKKVNEELAKQKNLAKEIYAKAVKNPKDFEKLAKEYSQDPGTKDKGGDLGYITKFDLVKEFSDVAFNQKVGSIAKAESPFGEHVIYVTDKKPQGEKSLSEVKAELKTFLEKEKKAEGLRNLLADLKKSAKVEYLQEDLKPEILKKQIETAQKEFIENQQKKVIPKSKTKVLEKLEKKETAEK